jgi:hypothetical protein
MQGVFSSVGQALHVSFLMEICPATQQCSTQVLLEWLKREAGIRPEERDEETRTLDFRGLQPLEVRGQCSQVRGVALNHLPGPERDVIWARYGHQVTRAKGVAGVAEYLRPLTGIHGELVMKALVYSVVLPGDENAWSLRQMSQEFGVPYSRLQRAALVVREHVKALRRAAEARLQPLFERTELVVEENVADETLQAA